MGASDNTPEYSEVRCVLRPDGTLRTRWRQGETMVHCTTNEEVFAPDRRGGHRWWRCMISRPARWRYGSMAWIQPCLTAISLR